MVKQVDMKVVCCDCKVLIRVDSVEMEIDDIKDIDNIVSHTYCKRCQVKALEEMNKAFSK